MLGKVGDLVLHRAVHSQMCSLCGCSIVSMFLASVLVGIMLEEVQSHSQIYLCVYLYLMSPQFHRDTEGECYTVGSQ